MGLDGFYYFTWEASDGLHIQITMGIGIVDTNGQILGTPVSNTYTGPGTRN